MTDLPIELWHLLFNRLELADLSSCALVSKAFYSAVKAYRVREIAFTRRVDKWFHSFHLAYRHQVDYSMAPVLKRSSFNFDFLKRLKIGRFSSIDLNVINNFVQLEILDIDLKNYRNEQSKTLTLADLRLLCLFMSEHLPYLELDTPRLQMVVTFSLKGLEFFYPESVQSIRAFHLAEKLSMFRNLENLYITSSYNELDYKASYDSEGIQEFSLRSLKKLKEINISVHDSFLRMNSNLLKKIIGNILALGRPDLKVFLKLMRITNPDLLAECLEVIENDGDFIAFQLRNYEMLKGGNLELNLYDLNKFLKNLRNDGFNPRSEEFLSKFFSKFSLRQMVVKGEVEEREVLVEFIERSPELGRLEFSDSGLDQSFFDRMADTVRLKGIPLRFLRLKQASNAALNFDFVSRLLDLECFESEQRPSAKLISKLLKLPLLTKITFSSDGHRIQRTETGEYLLNGNPISLQELLSRFDEKPHSTTAPSTTMKTSNPTHESTCKSTEQCGVM